MVVVIFLTGPCFTNTLGTVKMQKILRSPEELTLHALSLSALFLSLPLFHHECFMQSGADKQAIISVYRKEREVFFEDGKEQTDGKPAL